MRGVDLSKPAAEQPPALEETPNGARRGDVLLAVVFLFVVVLLGLLSR